MHILILGQGFLGSKYRDAFLARDYRVSTSQIDICSSSRKESFQQFASDLEDEIRYFNPDVIINCAAKSGRPNVDWCESHKLETLRSNVQGPLNLLQVCSKLQKYWIQLGSGCIYEGDNNGKGFSEDDPPNFFRSYYSSTKATLNELLKPFPVLQLRLRMPLDDQPGPRNLITKLASYPKIISLPNSVTFIDDLVWATECLIKDKAVGIYNIASPQPLTQHDILEAYRKHVDPEHKYEEITLEDLEKNYTLAGRSNCVLSTAKLQQHGILFRDSHEKLESIMRGYAANLARMKARD